MSDIRVFSRVAGWLVAAASRLGALHTKNAPGFYRYVGQEQRTSAGTGAYKLILIPNTATSANIHVTGADIYFYFDDAVTPSSTHGDTAAVGDDIPIFGIAKLRGFSAVRQGTPDFTLKVLYFSEERDE